MKMDINEDPDEDSAKEHHEGLERILLIKKVIH